MLILSQGRREKSWRFVMLIGAQYRLLMLPG